MITKKQIEEALPEQTIRDAMYPLSLGYSSTWLGTKEILVEALEARVLKTQLVTPPCRECGKPSACFGVSSESVLKRDGQPVEVVCRCSEHCSHENKKGWCKPLLVAQS